MIEKISEKKNKNKNFPQNQFKNNERHLKYI
jgi:hypothetical protein